MIKNIITMDREDIIKILAEKYGTNIDKVRLYYTKTVIEDDIRAEIELTNPEERLSKGDTDGDEYCGWLDMYDPFRKVQT